MDELIQAIQNDDLNGIKVFFDYLTYLIIYTCCHDEELIIHMAVTKQDIFDYIIQNTRGKYRKSYLDTINMTLSNYY